ncbi:SDR family NAD(P)-dependent oxidoreductase [Hoyosella rhizosphaerae]|uniref:Oxidoreductase n=1 Tax=Hoyosella rhizosphaerae TaxID=1755582 RepID=A0A916U2C8_9ACTN|nr:SDR family NAD(P)-dependent oxidoreductase [Hoyosella rhizosphaerae]GGC58067.1 oxidoreductase [Hoyosella rhizosphaerae]
MTSWLLSPPISPRTLFTRGIELRDKRVLITGASSGVGAQLAQDTAAEGAHVIAVARNADRLAEVRQGIVSKGGSCETYQCDITDETAVSKLLATVGTIDILVNNAGRSIRRPVMESVDRLHDFQRTIDLNYLAAVRMSLGVLPTMARSGDGHIINIATWGVHAGLMPKFAAYHASKAAIAAFGRSLAAENTGVHVTTIGFPLIRTPMIAPTEHYKNLAALTPQQASSWVITAMKKRPTQMHSRYAGIIRLIDSISPHAANTLILRAGI